MREKSPAPRNTVFEMDLSQESISDPTRDITLLSRRVSEVWLRRLEVQKRTTGPVHGRSLPRQDDVFADRIRCDTDIHQYSTWRRVGVREIAFHPQPGLRGRKR